MAVFKVNPLQVASGAPTQAQLGDLIKAFNALQNHLDTSFRIVNRQSSDFDVKGDLVVDRDEEVHGSLAVSGDEEIGGALSIGGGLSLGGNLGVGGDLLVHGDTVLGDDLSDSTEIKGDLTVRGKLYVQASAPLVQQSEIWDDFTTHGSTQLGDNEAADSLLVKGDSTILLGGAATKLLVKDSSLPAGAQDILTVSRSAAPPPLVVNAFIGSSAAGALPTILTIRNDPAIGGDLATFDSATRTITFGNNVAPPLGFIGMVKWGNMEVRDGILTVFDGANERLKVDPTGDIILNPASDIIQIPTDVRIYCTNRMSLNSAGTGYVHIQSDGGQVRIAAQPGTIPASFVRNYAADLYMMYTGGPAGADQDQYIYFYDAASPTGQYLRWDDAALAGAGRFNVSRPLKAMGGLEIGEDAGVGYAIARGMPLRLESEVGDIELHPASNTILLFPPPLATAVVLETDSGDLYLEPATGYTRISDGGYLTTPSANGSFTLRPGAVTRLELRGDATGARCATLFAHTGLALPAIADGLININADDIIIKATASVGAGDVKVEADNEAKVTGTVDVVMVSGGCEIDLTSGGSTDIYADTDINLYPTSGIIRGSGAYLGEDTDRFAGGYFLGEIVLTGTVKDANLRISGGSFSAESSGAGFGDYTFRIDRGGLYLETVTLGNIQLNSADDIILNPASQIIKLSGGHAQIHNLTDSASEDILIEPSGGRFRAYLAILDATGAGTSNYAILSVGSPANLAPSPVVVPGEGTIFLTAIDRISLETGAGDIILAPADARSINIPAVDESAITEGIADTYLRLYNDSSTGIGHLRRLKGSLKLSTSDLTSDIILNPASGYVSGIESADLTIRVPNRTGGGAGRNMVVQSGSAWPGGVGNDYGGNLVVKSGAGRGAGPGSQSGAIFLQSTVGVHLGFAGAVPPGAALDAFRPDLSASVGDHSALPQDWADFYVHSGSPAGSGNSSIDFYVQASSETSIYMQGQTGNPCRIKSNVAFTIETTAEDISLNPASSYIRGTTGFYAFASVGDDGMIDIVPDTVNYDTYIEVTRTAANQRIDMRALQDITIFSNGTPAVPLTDTIFGSAIGPVFIRADDGSIELDNTLGANVNRDIDIFASAEVIIRSGGVGGSAQKKITLQSGSDIILNPASGFVSGPTDASIIYRAVRAAAGAGSHSTFRASDAVGPGAFAGGNVYVEPGDMAGASTQGAVILRNIANNRTPDLVPRANGEGNVGTDALRFDRVRTVTLVTGDIGFDDPECAVCHKPFEVGQDLVMRVVRKEGKKSMAVPVHVGCKGVAS